MEKNTVNNTCVSPITKRNNKQKVLTRKRRINKELGTDVNSTKARNFGIAGIGRKKLIEESKMGEGCTEKYRFQCYRKITLEQRQAAFKTVLHL